MKYKQEIRKHPSVQLKYLLTAPLIYGMLIPGVFLDISVELYHRLSFPLYGIPYVKRSDYIRVDRHKLSYLNWFDKINCAYCGYMNGLFAYLVAIAAETETFWCGIMHAKYIDGAMPRHHKDFLPYGDKQALHDFELNKTPKKKKD